MVWGMVFKLQCISESPEENLLRLSIPGLASRFCFSRSKRWDWTWISFSLCFEVSYIIPMLTVYRLHTDIHLWGGGGGRCGREGGRVGGLGKRVKEKS